METILLTNKGNVNQAFEFKKIDKPQIKADEIGIAVKCFGINYADVMARNGLYREAPPMPCTIGYEVAGVVDSCPSNPGMEGKRVLAFTRFGGYSEYAVTPLDAVVEIPEELSFQKACALATQYVTAYYAIHECLHIHEGDRCMMHAAAGGVGIALIQMLKAKGARVYGLVGSDKKVEFIESLGVDYAINYRRCDYEIEMKKILGEHRLDVAFNSIGGSTYKKDKRLCGFGSKQVLYGGAERSGKKFGMLSSVNFLRKMGFQSPIFLMMKSQSIIGINMLKIADYKPHILQNCMKGVVDLYRANKINPIIDSEFSAKDIASAHKRLEERESIGKIVCTWQ
jgi:NADPH2:quinone reductase